jgi:Mg-chelatase subunit ChlD
MWSNARTWLISICLYAVILLLMLSYRLEGKATAALVQVVSTLIDQPVQEDFVDLLTDSKELLDLNQPVSLNPSGTGQGKIAGPMTASALTPMESSSAGVGGGSIANTLRNTSLSRPLATAPTGLKLDGNITGLVGAPVASGGDSGSVDRITQEILRQLEKGRVLVCWVMDASGSLNRRREQVVARFDRVYKELGDLGEKHPDALLTAVVAFGDKTTFMTAKPTSDPKEILKAVRAIKTDDSGKENVFAAVRDAALKFRRIQIQGRRTMMMIVLTDETGDDPALLDETVKLVKRNRIPVYVLGPMAPFGRKEISVRVVEEQSGEEFYLPIERGPETVQSEHLSLPYWSSGAQFDLFPSGFGPYALSRLARDSGGLYFLYDDDAIPGPKYNIYDMMQYTPDYLDFNEYRQAMTKHPLREAVVRAAEESKGALAQPPTRFEIASLNQRLTDGQKTAATTRHFVEKSLAALRMFEKERAKETSKRWQAHYDLMMGRLLASKVRCDEYNWALAQMKVAPKTPQKKENNAWDLVGDPEIAFGRKEGSAASAKAATNVKKSDPKATEKAKADADAAMKYLKRVVADHPNTPWAQMAQRELDTPLGFRWQEAFQPPPPKPGQPMTADAKAAAERQRRRAEAEKRLKKL